MSSYDNWRDEYQSRLKTPAQAMELIKEGDLVGISILTPTALTAAFEERAKSLWRVDIRGLAPREPSLYSPTGPKGEKEIELFIGDGMRPAHDAKIATYLPNTFMLGMKAHDDGRPEARIPDVWLTPCSAPNEAGYVHFGAHMWQRRSYAKRCPITIAMVDPNIYPVHGDVWMHVSDIHTFIEGVLKPVDVQGIRERVNTLSPEGDRAEMLQLLESCSIDQLGLVEQLFHMMPPMLLRGALGLVDIDPAAQSIADHVRQLIRDGDTIQVGVGQPCLLYTSDAADE